MMKESNFSKTKIVGGTRNSGTSFPFFSIVTVVYNSEKLIQETIDSIANQSDHDYEYIVIDGNSTDATLNIIRANADKIDYWQSETDKGLYDAMNKALNIAKGKYIVFINSGDRLNNSQVLANIKSRNIDADVYFGETNLIDHLGNILGTRSELSTRKLPAKLTWKSFQKGMLVSHQSILVRTSLAPKFNTQYRCSADIDWVIAILKKSKIIVNANLTISQYLVGGYSLQNSKLAWKERFQIYLKHYGWLRTIISHFYIAIRAIIFNLRGKKNY